MTRDEAAQEIARLILECAAEADHLPPGHEALQQKLKDLLERSQHPSRILTVEEVAEAFAGHRWIYAKTMPDNPHEYTLRREWADDVFFDAVVTAIRRLGYVTTYRGRQYTQLDMGEHFYWTMGHPISETILINRKRLAGYTSEQLAALREGRRG